METEFRSFATINLMLNRAISSMVIPDGSVLFRCISHFPLGNRDVYDCSVLLSKDVHLRRFDLDSFESHLQDGCTISNYGVWVNYNEDGLELTIKVIDNFDNYKKL